MNTRFPNDFAWGAATASYQIEGAVAEDGRGPSVWDRFCEWPGKIANGQTGAVACDHYHRVREDVGLMQEIGLQAYRFSFSWSRILPEGTGAVHPAGVAFYDELIDALLGAGITPWATLFHWDYPTALYNRGGWLNPDSPKWFADYTSVLAEKFGDRVHHWMTFNEPQCFIGLGHMAGIHAPGLKLSPRDIFEIQRNFLLSHGLAVKTLREASKQPAVIGIAPVSNLAIPATDSLEDVEAARQYGFGSGYKGRGLWFQPFTLDPIVLGTWPEEAAHAFCPEFKGLSTQDLETIKQPIDFIGHNYYQSDMVQASKDGGFEIAKLSDGYPRSGFDWPILPEGLYWSIRLHHERYGLPCAITENGLSSLDWVSSDGAVHDPQRISFIAEHVKCMGRAMEEGHPVLGYFHWSLMDNFEWAEGYRHRFGLVHVDYQTLKRTVKDSAYWYRDLIRSNAGILLEKEPVA